MYHVKINSTPCSLYRFLFYTAFRFHLLQPWPSIRHTVLGRTFTLTVLAVVPAFCGLCPLFGYQCIKKKIVIENSNEFFPCCHQSLNVWNHSGRNCRWWRCQIKHISNKEFRLHVKLSHFVWIELFNFPTWSLVSAPFIPGFILNMKIIPSQFVHFDLHTSETALKPFEGLFYTIASTDSTRTLAM